MRITQQLMAVLALLVAILAAGCDAPEQQAAGVGVPGQTNETGVEGRVGAAVAIEDSQFRQEEVVITVGEAVRWTNNDPVPHTVTGTDVDEELAPGESYTRTFTQAGTFEYACSTHPAMRGRVIVRT